MINKLKKWQSWLRLLFSPVIVILMIVYFIGVCADKCFDFIDDYLPRVPGD